MWGTQVFKILLVITSQLDFCLKVIYYTFHLNLSDWDFFYTGEVSNTE